MAKQRYINTKFWSDTFIRSCDSNTRYLYLYFLTNEHTNIAGVYELPEDVILFETGLNQNTLSKAIDTLSKGVRIKYYEGWVYIINFIKHQSSSEKIKKGIEVELAKIPQRIKDKIYHINILSIPYGYGSNYSNIDPNSNSNKDPNINRSMQAQKSLAVQKQSKNINSFISDNRELTLKWPDYTPSYIMANAYYFYWSKVYNKKPILNYAKIQKQFKNLGELLKHPEIFNAMIKFFCDRSDWLINNKHPLDIFIKNPNKYIGGEQTDEFLKLQEQFYSVERQQEYENFKKRRKKYVSEFNE